MEEPLHFLPRRANGRLGQCPPRPGSPALAPASDGGVVAEQPLLPDLGELPVEEAQLVRRRWAISSEAASNLQRCRYRCQIAQNIVS